MLSTDRCLLARDLADDRDLRDLVDLFERLCPNADGIWCCDTGAAVAAHLADRFAMTRRLRSGIFWHADEESYNATMGYEPGSEDWASWRDEAHCWVEIDRSYATVLLDPNGERVVGQPMPRLIVLDLDAGEILTEDGEWAPSPYEPVNGPGDCVAYAPDENIAELAGTVGGELAGAVAAADRALADRAAA